MRKTAAMQLVEIKEGDSLDKVLLRELNAGSTYADLSRRWNVTELTVARWTELFGLQREVQWRRETAGVVG